jgi:hypothetical protein
MAPDVTLDHLIVRAICQYREKAVRREEEKAEGEKESAPHGQRSYSLSGMAQTCLGCDLHAEECGEPHRTAELPCRDRQVLILMAKRRIASL